MIYVLILLAVLLVLAPLLALLPSARERDRAQLHRRAIELGLEIKPGLLPQSIMAERCNEAPVNGAAYRLPMRWRVGESGLWCRREDGRWENPRRVSVDDAEQARLEGIAARFPDGLVAIEWAPDGITAYWNEAGGPAALQQLAEALRRLAAAEHGRQPPSSSGQAT